MDIEELYKKYINGELSSEEVNSFEEKVKYVRSLKLKSDVETAIEKVEPQIIYKERKITFKEKLHKFLKKLKRNFILFLLICIILCVTVLIGYVKCSSHAKSNDKLGKYNAEDLAVNSLANDGYEISKMNVNKSDKTIVFAFPMERSYYLYSFRIEINGGRQFVVKVDSNSKTVEIGAY